jgi:hypothetical protein
MLCRAGRTLAWLVASDCLALACAADPGDPLKTSSAYVGTGSSSSGGFNPGPSSSSGSSSGGGSGVGSSSFGGPGSSSSGTSASSGGSSSSSSSSGAADLDSGRDANVGAGCAATSNSVAVGYYTQDMATSTSIQTIAFNVELSNAGFATIHLSDVTVRYWFSADGNPASGITFKTYYSANANHDITADVMGTFAAASAANLTATSDSYLEVSFNAAAGTLGPLSGGAADIQVALFDPKYQFKFNETNDYSFDPTKRPSMYQSSKVITAYVKGQLAWGCEPGAGGTGVPAGNDAGAGD